MYKIDKEIKTKLTEKEIKKKLYNISSKKRRASIFFIPNQEKFFIKEMEDSIVLYTILYYKNRGFVPKIKVLNYNLRFWFAKLNSWKPILDKYKCYQLRF